MSHPESNPSPGSGQVTPTRSSDGHSQPQVTHNDWLDEAAEWWSQALSEAGSGFRARLDEEAKRTQPQTQEQVSPEDFKRYVQADLHAVIRSYGCFIRMDMSTYEEAYNSARLYAWRRGAWGFSDTHLTELQDWIHDALADAIKQEG